MFASVSGSIIGIGLIAARRGSMHYALPFGTFLAIGAAVSATLGQPILTWYLNLW
jgi:prepilin signal peptidase PulO-like enzyme (type II secretory pathway)